MPTSSGTKSSEILTFWSKIFGFKVGDRVRLKWGKVTWTIYDIQQFERAHGFNNLTIYKLLRRQEHYPWQSRTMVVWDKGPKFRSMGVVEER